MQVLTPGNPHSFYINISNTLSHSSIDHAAFRGGRSFLKCDFEQEFSLPRPESHEPPSL